MSSDKKCQCPNCRAASEHPYNGFASAEVLAQAMDVRLRLFEFEISLIESLKAEGAERVFVAYVRTQMGRMAQVITDIAINDLPERDVMGQYLADCTEAAAVMREKIKVRDLVQATDSEP